MRNVIREEIICQSLGTDKKFVSLKSNSPAISKQTPNFPTPSSNKYNPCIISDDTSNADFKSGNCNYFQGDNISVEVSSTKRKLFKTHSSIKNVHDDGSRKERKQNRKDNRPCNNKQKVEQFNPTNHLKKDINYVSEKDVCDYLFGRTELEFEVVKIGDHSISRKMMATLKPGAWVIDQVIDVYAKIVLFEKNIMIPSTAGRYWYLDTICSQILTTDKCSYGALIDSFRRTCNGLDIEDCEQMFIPMNELNVHWYGILVDIPKESVFILDSIPDTRRRDMVERWIASLHAMLGKVYGERYKHSIYRYEVKAPTLPIQQNGYDCGIYVMKFIEASSVEAMEGIQLNSTKERRRIAKTIFIHALNERRDQLLLNENQEKSPTSMKNLS